ncbi:calnexin [Copidosoma floridanum]|uniref:calnexin n=1 Tax=Copidosoma floridanum TaxID=29053 RepID=UPI0006C9C871|nr:calnexin [Copidosoma floridanum]
MDGARTSDTSFERIWEVEEPNRGVEKGNLGLVLKSKAKHAAISKRLDKPFIFDDKPLIVQYEVIFQDNQICGGAYLKLLSVDPKHKDLRDFHDKTPYTIMFGPDKCGNDQKLHFIFRHKNPLNGSFEEKHAKKPKERLEEIFQDKQPHLYTLIVKPDNTFVIKVDDNVVNEGSLLDDFTPPVNPPLEIEDPEDKRPKDWDDREKIPDPTAVKPDDWDEDAPAQIVDEDNEAPDGWLENEPPFIPDPNSVKPEDWDEDTDGEWEPSKIENPKCKDAPGCGPYQKKLISNPQYKGKWLPPLINNPNYQGKWKPRLIHNPNYYNDQQPFKMTPIYAVGFELWSMSPDMLFDNIIVTDDELVAKTWAEDTFEIRKQRISRESETWWGKMRRMMNYKPGWWFAYLIYCSIPVCIYICFLISRAREPEDTKESQNDDEAEAEAEALIQKEKDADLEKDEEATEKDKAEETIEELEDKEESETEEIIPDEQGESSGKAEGPRRRKPNKE